MTVGTLMTADELLRLPDDGWRYELVRGELRKMSPAGAGHGYIAAEIVAKSRSIREAATPWTRIRSGNGISDFTTTRYGPSS